jgi:hypothetical protein
MIDFNRRGRREKEPQMNADERRFLFIYFFILIIIIHSYLFYFKKEMAEYETLEKLFKQAKLASLFFQSE